MISPPSRRCPPHTFEKAETLEEYSGLSRKTDADDELEEHAEALRSVDMKHVVRSPERPRSIYRSDIVLTGPSLEVEDDAPSKGIPYPEWDFKRGSYRQDWCYVQEVAQSTASPQWITEVERKQKALVRDLKKRFASIANEWLKAKRQPFGPDFDIDAVIEGEVSRAHGPHSQRALLHRTQAHTAQRCRAHPHGSEVFPPMPGSTMRACSTSFVSPSFASEEVLDEFVDRFAIAGFSSNTRRECGFHSLKTFGEDWRNTRARLGRMEAIGYTRIGPALRHGQELLMRENAERKVIILITDGRPL